MHKIPLNFTIDSMMSFNFVAINQSYWLENNLVATILILIASISQASIRTASLYNICVLNMQMYIVLIFPFQAP